MARRDRGPLVVERVVHDVLNPFIGDVLDPFVGTTNLRVTLGDKTISSGCDLKPSMVLHQPRVEVMVDPDAPSPDSPTLREYLHWLVTDSWNNWSNLWARVMRYQSPRPTIGTHRLVLVLFEQKGRQTRRQNFNTRDFAALYNLGSPVAAIYFNCQRKPAAGA